MEQKLKNPNWWEADRLFTSMDKQIAKLEMQLMVKAAPKAEILDVKYIMLTTQLSSLPN